MMLCLETNKEIHLEAFRYYHKNKLVWLVSGDLFGFFPLIRLPKITHNNNIKGIRILVSYFKKLIFLKDLKGSVWRENVM